MIDGRWVEKGAEYMAKARPDLWDKYKAEQAIYEWMADLAEHGNGCAIGTGGFMLTKFVEEYDSGETETTYTLTQNVVDICQYEDESEPFINRGFDWIDHNHRRAVEDYFELSDED